MIDVNAFLGSYPFRQVPGTSPEDLLRAMARVRIDTAWVSHLTTLFWRDPAAGNRWLYEVAAQEPKLRPVPAVHPGMGDWPEVVEEAIARDAPCVRCDPHFFGLAPTGAEVRALVAACGERSLPLLMAVRLEDGRQRHPNDTARDLTPAQVRGLIRVHPKTRLLVTHADREFIEQVHYGSTPDEANRIFWDLCWIWGPPEDHLEHLLGTIGADRFVFGTGQPLRLPETSVAKLDLIELTSETRRQVESGTATELGRR